MKLVIMVPNPPIFVTHHTYTIPHLAIFPEKKNPLTPEIWSAHSRDVRTQE